MRYLIVGLILLLLSVYLGIEISKEHNYVMIIFDHWVIESSLMVAVVVLIILFIILYVLFRLIGKASGISKKYHSWKKSRRDRKARVLTHHGLCELAEGSWAKAEETLLKAARINRKPLIDYLAAAKAAHAQNAYDRRDTYLRRAHQNDKDAAIAIGLTQAQLQIDGKQWEQALATLQHLQQLQPNHGFTLKLLAHVYIELKEWSNCQKLLQPLKKIKALPKKDYQELEHKVYLELLICAAEKEPETLNTFWKSMPREYQQDTKFIYNYIKALLKWKQDEPAALLIETSVKKQWSSDLVELYSQVRIENTSKQLQTAEHWHKKHPNDPALLLCLGELSVREKLWGKSEEFFKQSISIAPSTESYIKLGNLYEIIGESEKAEACFKETLKLIQTL